MNWLVLTPVLIPLIIAVLTVCCAQSVKQQRMINMFGAGILLLFSFTLAAEVFSSGIQTEKLSNWEAPFGIVFVVDHFSAIMVVVSAIVHFLLSIYSLGAIRRNEENYWYYTFLNMLLVGVFGAFTTGDIFNLYVWFEVMLISSFALLVMGERKEQWIGAVKYVALNLISTVLFLLGIALIYGMTGTLNMADLHLKIQEVDNIPLLTTIAVVFIVAFGIKSAIFPLYFWLPASYHTPPVIVSTVFAALLTKVGLYAFIRLFTLIFAFNIGFTHQLLLWMGLLSMIVGVLGALSQHEFRKILSYDIISSIGFMIMGLALFTPLSIMAAILYAIHSMFIKANLFMITGVVRRIKSTLDLNQIGGMYVLTPVLAFIFIASAFALLGFPPFSGFWGKLIMIKASIASEGYYVTAIIIITAILAIIPIIRVWNEVFWKPQPKEASIRNKSLTMLQKEQMFIPMILLVMISLFIGVFPDAIIEITSKAAENLLNPSLYVNAVLGVSP
jgi:multicomponent Na+:H+ antiporter subunit D